jgi:cyclin G-associated kinase
MSELLSYEQVKKVYRKAVLHIHPDKVKIGSFFNFSILLFVKLRGDPNERLAKLIFVELNEAWTQFEQETS